MGRRGRPPYPDILTPREWEVLALLREGLSNEAIAARLGITHAGAKYHVSQILSKLGVATREEAAAWQPAPAPERRPWWAAVVAWLRPITLGKAVLITAAVAALAGLGVLAWAIIAAAGDDDGAALPNQAAPSPVNPSLNQLPYLVDGELYLVNSDGTGRTRIAESGLCGANIQWSPDGALLLCFSGASTTLLRSDGAVVAQWSADMTAWPEWSPTGAGFATLVRDRLIIREIDGTELADLGPTDPYPVGISVAGRSRLWSPDGREIAYWNSASSDLRVYSLETHSERAVAGDYRPLAWLADGKTIVVAAGYKPKVGVEVSLYDVLLVDVSTGTTSLLPELKATLEGTIRPDLQLWFSPDTSRVAVLTSRPDGLPGLGVLDMSSRILFLIPDSIISFGGDYIPQANVQWSSDGQVLYWSDMGATGKMYRARADGTGLTALMDGPATGGLSPDLRSVVYFDASDQTATLYISEIDGSSPRVIDSRQGSGGSWPKYWWAWRPAP